MNKVRKQLYLDAGQQQKLRDYAARWGCSEASVMRIALDQLREHHLPDGRSPDDLDLDDGDEVLSDEQIDALEREIDQWAEAHPGPIGLSEAVIADREGR
jgi:hypothetical protein